MKLALLSVTKPDEDSSFKPGVECHYLLVGEERYRLTYQWIKKFLSVMEEAVFAVGGIGAYYWTDSVFVPLQDKEAEAMTLCQEFIVWRKKKVRYWLSILVS